MYITKSYMDNISIYHDGHSAPIVIIEFRKKRKTSLSENINTATSKYKYTCWQTWLYNYGELLICASSQSDWQILTWPEMLTQEFLQQFNIGFIRPGKILQPFTKFIVALVNGFVLRQEETGRSSQDGNLEQNLFWQKPYFKESASNH